MLFCVLLKSVDFCFEDVDTFCSLNDPTVIFVIELLVDIIFELLRFFLEFI